MQSMDDLVCQGTQADLRKQRGTSTDNVVSLTISQEAKICWPASSKGLFRNLSVWNSYSAMTKAPSGRTESAVNFLVLVRDLSDRSRSHDDPESLVRLGPHGANCALG